MTTTESETEAANIAHLPVDPRIWTRRVEVTRANGRKRLKVVFCLLATCLVLAVAFFVLHSPLFAARNLKVSGAIHTPAADVLSKAGLLGHPPLVDINSAQATTRIDSLPWVKSSRLSVHWPDSVTVTLTERDPIAAIDLSTGGIPTGKWALVDTTGRVLADVGALPAGLTTVRVAFDPGAPGSVIRAADLAGVQAVSSMPATILQKVVVVSVGPVGDVTLGLSGGYAVVIGEPRDLGAKFESLESVLAGVSLQKGDVINVSVPSQPTVSSSAS
jgi:cell division protein FtsQ